ncbi:MAG: hypothetical protein V1908_03410 [Candidatus Peregrinibacteria bacterium]
MALCPQCHQDFPIVDADRRFFKMFDVPEPTFCFQCRLQRKMAFYNRKRLYKRNDINGQPLISLYSPDKPVQVIKSRDWYGDSWDPMQYGRDFDFSRPFFPQFRELMEAVPQNALASLGDSENSDYTNDCYKLKNCYLIVDGEQAESAYYGETFVSLKSCMDFLFLQFSELCYECTASSNCYNLNHSQFCQNCSNGWFLKDCIGCKHCFGCVNLRNKEYHIFNEPKSKAEYEAFLADFHSGNYLAVQKMKQKVETFFATQPVKATRGIQNENVVGDNVNNSKNAHMCFDCNDQHDCRYMTDCLLNAKDSMDIHVWGDGMEECYNGALMGGGGMRHSMACFYSGLASSDLYYCYWCTRNCKELLGCVGLKHKEYCILNKQYTKSEYETLFARIKEHMKKTGEWGEFFPPQMSFFGYNETQAMDYFPMTRDKVLARGWKWCDYEPKIEVTRMIPASRLPDDIKDVPDDVLNWAIVCEKSGKPFKIIAQELKFYREHKLPLPWRHPDQRHWDRLALKEPFKLFDRQCGKCDVAIQTTHSPERGEIVYCENCYQKAVY